MLVCTNWKLKVIQVKGTNRQHWSAKNRANGMKLSFWNSIE